MHASLVFFVSKGEGTYGDEQKRVGWDAKNRFAPEMESYLANAQVHGGNCNTVGTEQDDDQYQENEAKSAACEPMTTSKMYGNAWADGAPMTSARDGSVAQIASINGR